MKKSLIALTVLSVLSTSAMANECNTIIEGSLFECVDADGQWAYLDKLGQNISFGDENDIVIDVYKNEDGTVTVQRQDENGDWNEVTLSEEEARASIKIIAKDRGIEAPIGVPNHGLNLKKGLDPRDKKGYNKLNERAQNSERVQEFHDIMESSGEYKGATAEERTAALESLLTDLQNDLSNMSKADQAKALAALNNITVSQKYDSVLDQVVNSWGLGTQEQKESFNEWNALSIEEKKTLLAERVGYVKPIDAIIDPIIDEPQNGTEFKQKIDGLVGEGTVDKYVEAEDKTLAAAEILATEGAEALMDIMIPNPSAGTSGEAKQISLYDYLDSVAKSDPDTFEPRMDSGEIVLRNAGLNLKEAGDNLVAQSKAAKVKVEEAIIATNEDIQRVETTLYKTHDAMELMNKKVEANTAATQTAVNDVKQVQNELDYTQEQLVLKTVSAKEALQDAALDADEQLSTHLQTKQEVAQIELTKSKVKLTKELESLQTQIDNLGNEVGVPGSGIDEGLIAGLEQAKVEVQAELDYVNALVLENANSISKGKVELAIAVDAMQTQVSDKFDQVDYRLSEQNVAIAELDKINDSQDDAMRDMYGVVQDTQVIAQNNKMAIDTGSVVLKQHEVSQNESIDFVTQLAIDTKNQANQTQLNLEIATHENAIKEDTLKASGIALNEHLSAQATEVYELASNVELMTNVTMQNANDISHGKVNLEIAATNMEVALTSQLKDLQEQIDRINSGDDGINPPSDGTGNDELIDGLELAKIEVQAEIDDVNALVAENENSVADGKDSLELAVESMNSELQAAKQTMSKELVTAKSTLVTGADALMAQLQAMQARMDSQDALIAELQAGNNPSIPVEGNGIDQDLRDGLQTAGATMQAQLGKAAETLKTASNGLKNNKPDAGVSPIAPTEPTNPEFNPRDHEFGSVGQGAAKDWKTAQVDAGKAQMKDYLDTEFKSFEDDLMARYSSDMADFQNDVQEQMDSVMASSHAISNSRPFLSNGGTAVGVGTGFSGDASAVAIGVAHSFVDTGWSVSGSVNATTGSDSDVSFGAGVQYQF